MSQKLNPSIPVKPQLGKYFIPSFWNGKPVQRDSWAGRISEFFERPSERTKNDKKIFQVFLEAVFHLSKNACPLDLTLAYKIQQEAEGSDFPSMILDPSLTLTPELDELRKASRPQSKQHELHTKFHADSLMHQPHAETPIQVDIDILNSLFESNSDPKPALDYLCKCFELDPSLFKEGGKDKLADTLRMFKEDRIMIQEALGATEKSEILTHLSKQLLKRIQELKVGEKKFVQFGYGPKRYGLGTLADIIRRLPESTLNTLPKELKDYLLNKQDLDLDSIAKKMIHSILNAFADEFKDTTTKKITKDQIAPFVANEDRGVPESVSMILPKIIDIYLDKLIKGGIFEGLSLVSNDHNVQQALSWLSTHGEEFLKLQDPNTLKKVFEEKLLSLLNNHIKTIQDTASKTISATFTELSTIVSPFLIEMLDLDRIMFSGPMWLEFEKNEDRCYNISVYSVGSALNYHPIDPKTQETYGVLRLKGIEYDNVNVEFIQAMLSRHLENFWNPEASSTAADIYNGPLKTLGVDPSSNEPSDPKNFELLSATPLDLFLALTSKASPFMFRFEAFAAYCKRYWKNGHLELPNLQTRHAITQMLQTLVKQSQNPHLKLSDRQKKTVAATLEEISLSLRSPLQNDRLLNSNSAFLNLETKNLIKELAQKFHISQEQLFEYQGIFSWIFGDDFNDLVDFASAQSILPVRNSVNQTNSIPAYKAAPSLYMLLYSDLTLHALRLASAALGIYLGGVWQFLNTPLLVSLLPYILPDSILRWYLRISDAIKKNLAELLVKASFYLFTNEDTRKQLREKLNSWKTYILSSKKFLNGENSISFDFEISPPFAIHAPASLERVPAYIDPLKPLSDETETTVHSNPSIESTSSTSIEIPVCPIPYPSRTTSIPAEDLGNVITQTMTDVEKIHSPLLQLSYLLDQIDRFEIPSVTGSSCWSTIEQPEIYLDKIARLAAVLNVKALADQEHFSRLLIANYKLLAIQDCLAKRFLSVREVTINPYPLLYWFQDNSSYLDDPLTHRQLEGISSYFFPDIDLHHLPSIDQLKLRESETLFYYPLSYFNLVAFNTIANSSFVDSTEAYRNPEYRYFNKILKDPSTKEKIIALGFPETLNDDEIRLLLFRESFVLCRDNPLVPKAFCLLRLQNFFCHIIANRNIVESKQLIEYISFNNAPKYDVFEYTPLTFSQVALSKLSLYPKINKTFADRLNLYKIMDLLYAFKTDRTRYTQTNILLENCVFNDGTINFDIEIKKKFACIFSEESEEIIQAIKFILEHEDSLSNVHQFLQETLFKAGRIQRTLTKSPDAAKAIGEMFSFLLRLNRSDVYHLRTIELGLKTKFLCQDISAASVKHFPDFPAALEKLPDSWNKLILLAIQTNFNPGNLESAKKILKPLALYYNQTPTCSLDLIYLRHLWISRGEIEKMPLTIQDILSPLKLEYQPLPISSTVIRQPVKQRIKVRQEELGSNLDALERFCPKDKISVYAYEGENHVSLISLGDKLHFEIRLNQNGKREAICDLWPDFHIAEKQHHPAVRYLASFLMLEGNSGRKKVLISKNQWMQMIIGRVAIAAEPLTNLLMFLLGLLGANDSSGFYVYDIEDGVLQSDDPEALGYLMMLCLAAGNKETLQQSTVKFEWLCNIRPVSDLAWVQLLPALYIPSNFSEEFEISQRILCALAQNKLIFAQNQDSISNGDSGLNHQTIEQSFASSSTTHVIMSLMILMRLSKLHNDRNPRNNLSAHHEYFLFQIAFEGISIVLKSFLNSNPEIYELFENIGIENFIEISGLNTNLTQRYNDLKRTLGLSDSNFMNLWQHAYKISKTKSSLPIYLYHGDPSCNQEDVEKNQQGYVSQLAYLFRYHVTQIRSLNLKKLFSLMAFGVFPFKEINPDILRPADFKTFFPGFYSIARQEMPDNKVLQQQKDLQYTLKLLLGTGDSQSNILMSYLLEVLENPQLFPHPIDLDDSKNSIREKYNYKLSYTDDHYKSYPKWYEFFHQLNDIITWEYMCRDIATPFYQSALAQQSSEVIADLFASRTIPVEALPPGPIQFGAALLETEVKSRAQNLLFKPVNEIKRHIPGIVANPFAAAFQFLGSRYVMKQGVKTLDTLIPRVSKSLTPSSILNIVAYRGFSLVGASMFRIAYAKYHNMNIRYDDVIPYGETAMPVLHMISKTYNYLKQQNVQQPESNSKSINPPDYSKLMDEDEAINAFLKQQFHDIFSERQLKKKPKTVHTLSPETTDCPLLKQCYRKIENSRVEDIKNNNSVYVFQVKREGAIILVYNNIKQFYTALKHQLSKEQKELLNLFGSIDPTRRKLTLNDIMALIDRQDLGQIGVEAGLTNETLPALELAAARILHKTARLQQVEKVLRIIEDIHRYKLNNNFNEYVNSLESLALELKSTTAFSFQTVPARILRHFLQFQAQTNTRLWKKQAETKQKVLSGDLRDVVTEEIPGSGKTFLFPLTAASKADGAHGVCTIFPKQLAGDNMRDIHKMLLQIYRKHSYVLQFKRDMNITIRQLQAILALIRGSILERQPIQMTKEDAQSLQSIFFDRMHCYRHNPKFQTPKEKECLTLLKKIRKELKIHYAAIVDEAHEALSHRKQLNYPIGSPRIIPENLYLIAEACMREIIHDHDIQPLIASNKLTAIDKKHYKTTIKTRIAEKMSRYWRLNLIDQSQRNEFIAFVCDKATSIPAWITSDNQKYSEISLIKGILNILLPMTFSKTVQVQFGASKQDNGEFARPSDGNSHVLESDSIRSPYETLIKTFLMLQVTKLNQTQANKLWERLFNAAHNEMKKRKVSYPDTTVFKKFGKIVPKLTYDLTMQQIELLRREPESSLLYMRHFIWKQIHYWVYNIQNTAQDFASIFEEYLLGTGTPYNDGTYHQKFTLLEDPTTLGETLRIFASKCKGIRLLKTSEPIELLQEMLERFFKPGSRFTGLVDGAPLLVGMENRKAAEIIADFCRKHRPDIKAVKYYQEDTQGNEAVTYLQIGKSEGELKPNLCITYYDQRHGFGANIPQEDILVTVGPYHPLFKLIQEVMRCSGLKNEQQLKALENLIVKLSTLKFEFVMTYEQMIAIMDRDPKNPAIRPIGKPTLEDIIDYAIRNQAVIAKTENYESMHLKYGSAPKHAVDDKILMHDDDDFHGWMSLFEEFERLFVQKNEYDPAKIFGLLKKRKEPKIPLEIAKLNAIKKVENSSAFSSEELDNFKESLNKIPVPPLPKTVAVYENEDGSYSAVDELNNLGQENTIHQTTLQTVDVNAQNSQESEAEQQRENERQNVDQKAKESKSYYERDWPIIDNPSEISWLTFSDPSNPTTYTSSLIQNLIRKPTVQFFNVQQLAAASSNEAIVKIATMLDPRLWMSNNYLHIWPDTIYGIPIELGTKGQMPLEEVLVTLEEANGTLNIISVGPLTIKEASFWRKKLNNDNNYWQEQKFKLLLWDVKTRTVQAGFQADLRDHVDFNTLIGQLKFLNGDGSYQYNHPHMIQWIKSNHPSLLNEAFEHIWSKRHRNDNNRLDIDVIFMNSKDAPLEEML